MQCRDMYAGAIVIPNYGPETLIPDLKISIFWSSIPKRLTQIYVAFIVDPDPEVSDLDPMAHDPDPKPAILIPRTMSRSW